jgi:hypothetical protein
VLKPCDGPGITNFLAIEVRRPVQPLAQGNCSIALPLLDLHQRHLDQPADLLESAREVPPSKYVHDD